MKFEDKLALTTKKYWYSKTEDKAYHDSIINIYGFEVKYAVRFIAEQKYYKTLALRLNLSENLLQEIDDNISYASEFDDYEILFIHRDKNFDHLISQYYEYMTDNNKGIDIYYIQLELTDYDICKNLDLIEIDEKAYNNFRKSEKTHKKITEQTLKGLTESFLKNAGENKNVNRADVSESSSDEFGAFGLFFALAIVWLMFAFPKFAFLAIIFALTTYFLFGEEIESPKEKESILSKTERKLKNIAGVIFLITTMSASWFALFCYLPLSSRHETMIDEAKIYESVEHKIYTGELHSMRFYTSTTNVNGYSEYKLNFTTPEKIEKSGLCKVNDLSYTVSEMCDSYESYKKAMALIDSYQYEPKCLLDLDDANYEKFVRCSKWSPAFKDPINKLVE